MNSFFPARWISPIATMPCSSTRSNIDTLLPVLHEEVMLHLYIEQRSLSLIPVLPSFKFQNIVPHERQDCQGLPTLAGFYPFLHGLSVGLVPF